MSDPNYILRLIDIFAKVHGCEARYIETVPVHEEWQGTTVWEGDVEVFDIMGHPKAARGYAWNYDKEKGSAIVAVLELPPVKSPKTAVQVALLAANGWKPGETFHIGSIPKAGK